MWWTEHIIFRKNKNMGAPVCLPHDCICGGKVDALGHHCFICRKGNGKQVRHSLLNDAIWRSFGRAKIQAQKEPTGLCFSFRKNDGSIANKRPDGASIVPWGRGRNIAWDMWRWPTRLRLHICHSRQSRQELLQNVPPCSKLQSMRNWRGTTYSRHWHVRWRACGVRRQWRFSKSWGGAFRRWQVTNGRLRFCFSGYQLRCRRAMQHACWVHSQSRWTPFQTSAPLVAGYSFYFIILHWFYLFYTSLWLDQRNF